MATTFYITAGLPALDSVGSLPTDDITRTYITAGLDANDYVAAGGGLSIPGFFSSTLSPKVPLLKGCNL